MSGVGVGLRELVARRARTHRPRTLDTLLELLMRSHTAAIVALDSPVLRHLCASLTEGLKSHEVATSSQCAAALEHLAN